MHYCTVNPNKNEVKHMRYSFIPLLNNISFFLGFGIQRYFLNQFHYFRSNKENANQVNQGNKSDKLKEEIKSNNMIGGQNMTSPTTSTPITTKTHGLHRSASLDTEKRKEPRLILVPTSPPMSNTSAKRRTTPHDRSKPEEPRITLVKNTPDVTRSPRLLRKVNSFGSPVTQHSKKINEKQSACSRRAKPLLGRSKTIDVPEYYREQIAEEEQEASVLPTIPPWRSRTKLDHLTGNEQPEKTTLEVNGHITVSKPNEMTTEKSRIPKRPTLSPPTSPLMANDKVNKYKEQRRRELEMLHQQNEPGLSFNKTTNNKGGLTLSSYSSRGRARNTDHLTGSTLAAPPLYTTSDSRSSQEHSSSQPSDINSPRQQARGQMQGSWRVPGGVPSSQQAQPYDPSSLTAPAIPNGQGIPQNNNYGKYDKLNENWRNCELIVTIHTVICTFIYLIVSTLHVHIYLNFIYVFLFSKI